MPYRIITPSSKPSFWLLHISGWIGYIILMLVEDLLIAGTLYIYSWALALIFIALIGASFTLILRYIYRKLWSFSPIVILASAMVCCLLFALPWTYLKNNLLYEVYSEVITRPDGLSGQFSGFAMSWFMLMTWSCLYFSINLYYRLTEAQQNALAAQALSHKSQIRMLRYQLNPHFLFNTLNALSTLVMTQRTAIANGIIERLSEFLRFSLDNDPENKIKLSTEIEILMSYLDIEKVRFSDRLSIELNIAPGTENCLIPSLLLQPLVENSIKYAISPMKSGGIISISATKSLNKLIITISDNGMGCDIQHGVVLQGEGIGLKNTRERLSVLYGEAHRFQLFANEPQGFTAAITLPFETDLA